MYQRNPEFDKGARGRKEGKSITQAQKHIDRYNEDGRKENRRGWIAMDEYLIIAEIAEEG